MFCFILFSFLLIFKIDFEERGGGERSIHDERASWTGSSCAPPAGDGAATRAGAPGSSVDAQPRSHPAGPGRVCSGRTQCFILKHVSFHGRKKRCRLSAPGSRSAPGSCSAAGSRSLRTGTRNGGRRGRVRQERGSGRRPGLGAAVSLRPAPSLLCLSGGAGRRRRAATVLFRAAAGACSPPGDNEGERGRPRVHGEEALRRA